MSTSKTLPRQRQGWLGELEHMLLLAILQRGDAAYAPDVAETLAERAHRRLSRGALYSTLDRLEKKGYIIWTIERGTPERSGSRRRRFEVTVAGMEALRASHGAIHDLAEGLGAALLREEG